MIHLVTDLKPIESQFHLPNGEMSPVTHVGIVQLTTSITLRDVLVVPKFQFNLLSISQLTNHSACTVFFSSTKCILQDHALMMETKIGSLVDGLYKLQTADFISHTSGSDVSIHNCQFNKFVQSKWHWRLVHPSTTILIHIPEIHIPKSVVLDDCEICHKSKQSRLPFPVSESKSTGCFDIVNCDV